tara:strand:- start:1639 stop:2292 length:654 start_codon:yes stop_codon:yes gene_type:complete
MEIINDSDLSKKTFLSHVFSTTEEGQAELLNVIQYSSMGVVPVVMLNKIVQRFIPEADPEKSTLELLAEIFIQLTIMFCGAIIIHRAITYLPTYSGFKYENLTLTNVILVFLIIVLSIQTKLGLKVNILVDRVLELWNGPSTDETKQNVKQNVRVSQHTMHAPSQADHLDNSQIQGGSFPPAPVATARPDMGMGQPDMSFGPMAANGALGGSFGAAF